MLYSVHNNMIILTLTIIIIIIIITILCFQLFRSALQFVNLCGYENFRWCFIYFLLIAPPREIYSASNNSNNNNERCQCPKCMLKAPHGHFTIIVRIVYEKNERREMFWDEFRKY